LHCRAAWQSFTGFFRSSSYCWHRALHPLREAFDAIRKAMWRHKHRGALSDWRYHSGGYHYDEQTKTWQVWDGSRYVPDKGQRPDTFYGDEADAFDRHARGST
jgi:hypothetical protein